MNTAQRMDALHQLVSETECLVSGSAVSVDTAINAIHQQIERVKTQRGNVYVIGNGGSAGIAAHHVVDLVNVAQAPALFLGEPGLLSCMGNDYGYESTFSRPLQVLARPGDLLVAISSSGQSKNIVQACEVMRGLCGTTITLSGFHAENPLRRLGDISLWTGKEDYGLVETAHFFLLHTVIDLWKYYGTNRTR